jgi:hypothetical protein
MRRRWTIFVSTTLAAALTACSGSSEASYVDSAVVSAHEGLSAVGTLHQVVQADAAGRLFPPFTSASVDDVLATATKALDDLESQPPPGAAAQQVYDELHPRLQDAVARASDAREALSAGDENRATVLDAQLVRVSDQLSAFLRSHQ